MEHEHNHHKKGRLSEGNRMVSSHDHSDESIEDSEISDWKKRLIGAWIFTIPIAIIMLLDRFLKINLETILMRI